MKLKHAIFVLLFGWIVIAVAAVLKLESFPLASELMMLGTAIQVIGLVLTVYKLLMHPKVKDFLNQ